MLDYVPLLVCLAIAAVIDVRSRRIPNWLTFGLILAGLSRAIVVGGGAGLGHAATGLLAGAAPAIVLFTLGALGGGDVKLLAGVGAWVGGPSALAVFTLQCVIGLAYVLICALCQGRTIALLRNTSVLACEFAQKGVAACAVDKDNKSFRSVDQPLPYAVPVGLATILVLVAGTWMGI
jgi:prepilin peptidase CpaA